MPPKQQNALGQEDRALEISNMIAKIDIGAHKLRTNEKKICKKLITVTVSLTQNLLVCKKKMSVSNTISLLSTKQLTLKSHIWQTKLTRS